MPSFPLESHRSQRMQKENGRGDHDDQENRHDDNQETDWVERHLVKIIVAAGALCILGLVGRAMTG